MLAAHHSPYEATVVTQLRARSRRLKALWTLYTLFAYVLAATILLLVTGYANWSLGEYAGMLGGPVAILGGRWALDAYYAWRIGGATRQLAELQKKREKTVHEFKEAMKYGETRALLSESVWREGAEYRQCALAGHCLAHR